MRRLSDSSIVATSVPTTLCIVETEMFSSCPVSALVAGEKRGGAERVLSRHPGGKGPPARGPPRLFSPHPAPPREPPTTHPTPKTPLRRDSNSRPPSAPPYDP